MSIFWLPIAMALIFTIVCETETVVIDCETTDTDEFLAVTLMELLTVTLLPAALYMFQTAGIRASLRHNQWKSLKLWGSLRLLMVTMPMLADTLLYYIYMNVSFAYMAIICVISMVFIYPSKTRCDNEISIEE